MPQNLKQNHHLMNLNDFYKVGYIAGTYGFNGEVKLIFEAGINNKVKIKEPVFIEINKKPVPFFIERLIKENTHYLIAKLEGIDTVDQCKDLSSYSLYLPKNSVEKDINPSFLYNELIGYEVFENETKIGNISNVLSYPQQQLAQLYRNGREILFPINPDTIKKVNHKSRRVDVNLPEGLMDIYS